MKKIPLTCIIDDDPIYIFGAQRMMKIGNLCESFMIFHNGKNALDTLQKIILNEGTLPDLILLDLNMPIMDGWEFLDAFIKIPCKQKITIYIITSSIDNEDVMKAKTYSNVSNYILKPVTIDGLKEILEKI
ncbi:response regulator [Flavobacterium sp. SM2513]|uniref:response regulator n=1 Tax=Flavobacterium sp. SM2513 TaxID=3424766 RepID=UPI003D7F79EF